MCLGLFSQALFPLMYTLEELQAKTFKELKAIGYQFDTLPVGDKRSRQNWIDAIGGVLPPLLQLLETFPGVDRPRNRSIEEIDFAEYDELTFLDVLELCCNIDKQLADKSLKQLQHLRTKVLDLIAIDRPSADNFSGNKTHRASWIREVRHQLTYLLQNRSLVKAPRGLGRVEVLLWKGYIIEDFDALLLHVKFFPQIKDAFVAIEVHHQQLIVPAVEIFPAVEVESVAEAIEVQHQELIEPKFGRIVYPRAARLIAAAAEAAVENFPGVKVEQRQEPIETFSGIEPIQELIEVQRQEAIALAVENSPGVTFDPVEFSKTHAAEIDNYFASFTDDRFPNRGDNGRGRLEIEPKLSQSAIAPADKNPPGLSRKTSTAHQLLELLKSSARILEPIENSPGVTFSPRFLALYSPPRSENIHFKFDADGQLSLLDFEIESVDEPPEPDDFEVDTPRRKRTGILGSISQLTR